MGAWSRVRFPANTVLVGVRSASRIRLKLIDYIGSELCAKVEKPIKQQWRFLSENGATSGMHRISRAVWFSPTRDAAQMVKLLYICLLFIFPKIAEVISYRTSYKIKNAYKMYFTECMQTRT